MLDISRGKLPKLHHPKYMVIFFAGFLSGEKGDYTKYVKKIIFEYETLWDMKNKSVGKDGFTKFVNNFVNDSNK